MLLLDALATLYPNPSAKKHRRRGRKPGDPGYGDAYARDQFMQKVRHGSPAGAGFPPLFGKDVLEIGCGHGGISCYLAAIGANRVLGIDLDLSRVEFGQRLAESIGDRRGARLPVEFAEMDASALELPSESFDVVVAENVFEHFDDPEAVLREVFRVLRPGGHLVVPVFSSIVSKHGLHLKTGLGLPWANLAFSERSIVGALERRARRNPRLYETYPGLRDREVRRVRDVRRYRDLNDITYERFRGLAHRVGFQIESFHVHRTVAGRVLARVLPGTARDRVDEVLSTGAAATLRKPT